MGTELHVAPRGDKPRRSVQNSAAIGKKTAADYFAHGKDAFRMEVLGLDPHYTDQPPQVIAERTQWRVLEINNRSIFLESGDSADSKNWSLSFISSTGHRNQIASCEAAVQ